MKTISHLVALSNNNVIGIDNDLPWNLKTDLKHFKEYTTNKIIIMGRKTFESIGKPLPNRINLIVSTTITTVEGAYVFKNTTNALNFAKQICLEKNLDEIVIIGGGYLFRETLPIVDKLILTKVECNIRGDVFYPDIDLKNWQLTDTRKYQKNFENDYDFEILTLEKAK